MSGVIHVNLFCLFVFIVFKLPSTYDFKGYADKSILILLLTSFINGVVTEIIFCFVFKLLIVAYVEFAVDVNK